MPTKNGSGWGWGLPNAYEGGDKNRQNLAYVVYGWPPMAFYYVGR